MKNSRQILIAIICFLAASVLMASDRYGYSIVVPSKNTRIIITCRDVDSIIVNNAGFKGLPKPLAEVLAGVSEELPANRTYLVYLRSSRGKIFCHVDEEPVGEHVIVKEFSFTGKEWWGKFVNVIFKGITGKPAIIRRHVKIEKTNVANQYVSARIELGAVPGEASETWFVNW